MCLLPRAFIRSASSWSSSSCCISSIGSSPSTFSSFSAGGSIAIGIAPRPFLGLTSSILDSFLLGSCDNRSLGLSFAGYLSYSNKSKGQLFTRNRCRVSCGGRSNDRSETSENSPTFPSMCLQSTHTIDHFLRVFSYSSQSLTEHEFSRPLDGLPGAPITNHSPNLSESESTESNNFIGKVGV